MRDAAVASSAMPSRLLTCRRPMGAQHITLPFPALLRPVSSQAMAPDWAAGSPACRFCSAARVSAPTSWRFPRRQILSLSAKLGFGELQPVVSPEAALADEQGGDAEHATRQGQIGVLAQAVLDLLVFRPGHQRLAVEARLLQRALDHGGVGDVVALPPVRVEESVHGLGALAFEIGGDAGAQGPDGADGKGLGDLHLHPVLLRPARRVLAHVLELLRRRDVVPGRLAQPAERDRQQARLCPRALLDAGELRGGEIAVRRAQVVEEIEGLRHPRPSRTVLIRCTVSSELTCRHADDLSRLSQALVVRSRLPRPRPWASRHLHCPVRRARQDYLRPASSSSDRAESTSCAAATLAGSVPSTRRTACSTVPVRRLLSLRPFAVSASNARRASRGSGLRWRMPRASSRLRMPVSVEGWTWRICATLPAGVPGKRPTMRTTRRCGPVMPKFASILFEADCRAWSP